MKKYSQLMYIILAFLIGTLISTITTIRIVQAIGGNDLIYGCVANNGRLTIINSNQTCSRNETSLNWNARGLPGTGALVENLHGAQISNTDFRWRTLKDDDFSGTGCSLDHDTFDNHTDLTSVNITNCDLSNSNFNNVDFTGITMGHNKFASTIFSESNLSNKDLTSDSLPFVHFISSNLSGVIASNSDVSGAVIQNSNLSNANFSNIHLAIEVSNGVDFSSSNLTNTNFTGIDTSRNTTSVLFDGTSGSNTNFTNANLINASFNGSTLTNTIWSNTTCPDGTNSNSNGGTCSGHGPGL